MLYRMNIFITLCIYIHVYIITSSLLREDKRQKKKRECERWPHLVFKNKYIKTAVRDGQIGSANMCELSVVFGSFQGLLGSSEGRK